MTAPTPKRPLPAALYAYGYFYYRKATAGDPGATLTITETGSPSGTTWLAAALAAYPGASGTQPDVAGSVAANDVLHRDVAHRDHRDRGRLVRGNATRGDKHRAGRRAAVHVT